MGRKLVQAATDGSGSRVAIHVDALLRVVAGLMLVPHGAMVLFGWFGGQPNLGATAIVFEEAFRLKPGLLWAVTAGVVELAGGLALALGLFTRFAALTVVVLLLVAAYAVSPAGWFWHRGGFEFHVLWACVAASYMVKGGGPFSLDSWLHGVRS